MRFVSIDILRAITMVLMVWVNDFLIDLNEHIYGNPSSIHREGQAAKAVVEKSRRQLANALNSNPEEIIFTSSGSERSFTCM